MTKWPRLFETVATKESVESTLSQEFILAHRRLTSNDLIFIMLQVLFDALGCLRKYESPLDILKEFFELRLERYAIRKAWLEGMLTAESDKLNSQARFILEKIEGNIVIGKCSFLFLGIG